MNRDTLLDLLGQVAAGRLRPDEALGRISPAPCARLAGGVTLDLDRACRTGQCEVVFGQGKSAMQLEVAIRGLQEAGQPCLATRITPETADFLLKTFPDGRYHADPRLFLLGRDVNLDEPWPDTGEVMVVSAGAADLPVALEAYATARFFGAECGLVSDCGVAGLHRLARAEQGLIRARVHVVVAGMEGALPSVVAGLYGKPVIGVPTSVGYGAGFGGIAALLSMLNTCAPGVAVVNIDNGYGAGALAAKILSQGGEPS